MTVLRELGRLAKDSLVYGIAGMVLRFMSAFLVPIYARTFSPAEYGSLSIVLSTVALLGVVVVLGLDNSAARWYFESDDLSDRKTSFSTWAWMYLSTGLVIGIALFAAAEYVAGALLESEGETRLFQLAAATLPANVLGHVLFVWLRVQRRAWAAVGYTLFTGVLTIVATLILVVGMDRGVAGVFESQIIAGLAGSSYAVAMMRGWLRPSWFRRERLLVMLRYAAPLIPAAFGFWVINLSDRYLLRFLASQAEVGQYQVAYSVSAITYLATAAFQTAWGPFAFSIHREPRAREVYAGALLAYGWVASLVAAGTAMLAPEVIRVIATTDYSDASVAVPWLVFAHVLLGGYYIATVGPTIVKNMRPVATAVAIGATVNLAFGAILIPPFGIAGAGASTLVAYASLSWYLFARSQILYPVPYRFAPVMGLAAWGFSMSVLASMWAPDKLWLGLISKLGLLALFVPAAIVFRLTSVADVRHGIRSFLGLSEVENPRR